MKNDEMLQRLKELAEWIDNYVPSEGIDGRQFEYNETIKLINEIENG